MKYFRISVFQVSGSRGKDYVRSTSKWRWDYCSVCTEPFPYPLHCWFSSGMKTPTGFGKPRKEVGIICPTGGNKQSLMSLLYPVPHTQILGFERKRKIPNFWTITCEGTKRKILQFED